jgi:hypothetical protein
MATIKKLSGSCMRASECDTDKTLSVIRPTSASAPSLARIVFGGSDVTQANKRRTKTLIFFKEK